MRKKKPLKTLKFLGMKSFAQSINDIKYTLFPYICGVGVVGDVLKSQNNCGF